MSALEQVAEMSCWSGAPTIERFEGGMSNEVFLVQTGESRYVARILSDNPIFHVDRRNEVVISRAAYEAGLSPRVVHYEPGRMVTEFIESAVPLSPDRLQDDAMLERVFEIVSRCHRTMGSLVHSNPPITFSTFDAVRGYAATLKRYRCRLDDDLDRLLALNDQMEQRMGGAERAFGHNDLLVTENIIDDGDRLWLVDWEYGGWNYPHFDLCAVMEHAGVDAKEQTAILTRYFGDKMGPAVDEQAAIMKAGSLLREAMWALVSEKHNQADIDFVAYTDDYLARFEKAVVATGIA
ncbi:MAG: choline kinase family protein [Pseudomonadota bacterium]